MRIIPVDSSRPLLMGLLVAAALVPLQADARQDATAEPRSVGPRARADGWKPKGTADTKETSRTQPPPAITESQAADDATREETPGSAAPAGATATPPSRGESASRPAKGDESAKAPSKETRPAGKPPTVKKDSPATRMLASGKGQMSLAEEKAAVDMVTAKTSIDEILAVTLPSRSDSSGDWSAGPEPLHRCGEPRWIEPCIPLPPCHPSLPPHPFDLVGVPGEPTDGPIYAGPCCPRTGSRDDGPWAHVHRVQDRFFDAFYRTK